MAIFILGSMTITTTMDYRALLAAWWAMIETLGWGDTKEVVEDSR